MRPEVSSVTIIAPRVSLTFLLAWESCWSWLSCPAGLQWGWHTVTSSPACPDHNKCVQQLDVVWWLLADNVNRFLDLESSKLNRFSKSSAIDKTFLYNVNVKCQIVTNSNFSLHRESSEDIQNVTIEPSEQKYSFSYLCPPMIRMTEAAQREHEQPWPPVHGLLRAEGPLQNQTSTKSTGDSS